MKDVGDGFEPSTASQGAQSSEELNVISCATSQGSGLL
jgi:hypothetical protein